MNACHLYNFVMNSDCVIEQYKAPSRQLLTTSSYMYLLQCYLTGRCMHTFLMGKYSFHISFQLGILSYGRCYTCCESSYVHS